MSRPGYFRQFITNFKKSLVIARQKEVFSGQDLDGNRYFEKSADPEKQLKRQRRIETRDKDNHAIPDIPVEWMTWLQGRRETPPTAEEIEKNYVTMAKTLHRAKELENEHKMAASEQGMVEESQSRQAGGSIFPKYEDLETIPGEFKRKKPS